MATVLHLVSQLEEGGTQRQLAYIAQFKNRYDVEIASLIASPQNKLFPYFQHPDIPVHYLSNSADFYAPQILPALDKLLASRQYDLIHCRLYSAIVQGVLAARKSRIPVIVSPGNMVSGLELERNKSWEKILIRKALRAADLVMFPSHSSAIDFVEAGWVHKNRVRSVLNGVDTEHFVPPDTAGESLVAVGRISEQKAYDDLREVMAMLRTRFPDITCLIAGGGGEPPEGPGLQYAGIANDIREIYRRAAIFVSTSKAEGLSNALLEAQAMGIPAVVRDIGPNSEIIDPPINGFLARTTEEYTEFCSRLLKDRSLRERMRFAARQKMEKEFSIRSQVKKIEQVYDELLGLVPIA